VASAVAFLLSELADFAVYTPLQQKRFVVAVVASSLVGLTVDSFVFLYLAFGSLDYLLGQIIGKAWMVLFSIPVIRWIRQRDLRLGISPA
jgi:queuosine precursor transporter